MQTNSSSPPVTKTIFETTCQVFLSVLMKLGGSVCDGYHHYVIFDDSTDIEGKGVL